MLLRSRLSWMRMLRLLIILFTALALSRLVQIISWWHMLRTLKEMNYTIYVIDAKTGVPVGKPLVSLTSYLSGLGMKLWFMSQWMRFFGRIRCGYISWEQINLVTPAFIMRRMTCFLLILKLQKANFFCLVHLKVKVQELLACPVDNTSDTTVLIPHRESVKIQDIQLFTDHLVVYERENGLPKIITYRLPAVGEPLKSLQSGQSVDLLTLGFRFEENLNRVGRF
ncbi:hypothetical protein LWI29_019497 [Acer saccharum]|uniref:Peptidase S9A N-terminal domain-containing protein n=1 Tax=Acer saccharum TaxID=4024 RepID=A0AA39RI89_ACESA|nr:hypothetical protein LWI29_019497 [Acer saccharum]